MKITIKKLCYRLAVIALFSIIIICCGREDYDDIPNQFTHSDENLLNSDNVSNSSTIQMPDWENCISQTGLSISNDNVDLFKIGMYHNFLLADVEGKIDISNCTESQVIEMENSISLLIDSNPDYIDIFGSYPNRELINPGFYFNRLNWCENYTHSQYIDIIENILLEELNNCQLSGLFSQSELNTMTAFFNDVIRNEGNSKINVEPFYSDILQNKENFFLNGNPLLALVVVYDYSYCFWEEYSTNLSNRRLINPLGFALADLAGGAVGMYANIYRNREHYMNQCGPCCDVDILEDIGRGAAGASAGPFGYFF
jgi:hypothetical protein